MEVPVNVVSLLGWATVLSALAVIGTVVAIPWVVARLPPDYFSRPRRTRWREVAKEPLLAIVIGVVKNALGMVLLLLGLIMLVTPGQGLLTILIGLLLLNFPGKYRLERWLILRPGVLRWFNHLRRRRGRPPLASPEDPPSGGC